MQRVLLLLVAILVELAGAQPLHAQAEQSGSSVVRVGPHRFHRRMLENGLRAVAVKSSGNDATVFMVVGAGKRQETPTTTGLAHLTEHAMYTGTGQTEPGGHDRRIHAMGGESNAFTREDYTLFYDHRIPLQRLGEVLAMEADRLRHLKFNVDAFLMERGRLEAEEKRTFEPSTALTERLEAAVFRQHPYGAGVLDDAGHTKAPGLEIDVVRAFYDLHYQPDNTAVVVAGNIDPTRALDLVSKAFGSLPRGPARPATAVEPVPTEPRRITLPSTLTRARCEMVWIVPAMGHPDRPVLKVLARLVSQMTLEDGSPVEATMGERVDRDMFRLISTGPASEVGLMKLLSRLRASGFQEEELRAACDLVCDDFSGLPLRARPYFSLAGTFGVREVFGKSELLGRFEKQVRALTGDAVKAVAMRHLDPARVTTVVFEPSNSAKKPLPRGRTALMAAAQEAEAAGDYARAVAAYTKLLDLKINRMYRVIYLTERGTIRMKQKQYEAAIEDFETALAVVDYPAVRDLLEEARALKEKQGSKKESTPKAPTSRDSGK